MPATLPRVCAAGRQFHGAPPWATPCNQLGTYVLEVASETTGDVDVVALCPFHFATLQQQVMVRRS